MALSDEEQKLLAQLEASLTAEDPKLATAMRGDTPRKLHRRRAALAGLGFLIGVTLLVGGMEIHPLLSVLGFLVMLFATVTAIGSWRHVSGPGDGGPHVPGRPAKTPGGEGAAFMEHMEERWRKRQQDGL